METSDFRRRIEETVKAVRLYVEHDMRDSDNVQQALQERNAEEWEYNDCGPDWTRMRARTTAEFADELAACQTIGDLLLFRGRMERVKIHASAQELCPVVGAAHYMLQMSYCVEGTWREHEDRPDEPAEISDFSEPVNDTHEPNP